MESVLLPDDRGVVGEKRHRLATRGAWLLGETLEQRKSYFRSLRDAYGFASSVLHAGRLKKKGEKARDKAIAEAQGICRAAILRIAEGQGRTRLDGHRLGVRDFIARPEDLRSRM